MLLQVGRTDWLLFEGLVAATLLGYSTKEELIKNSVKYWSKGLPRGALLATLRAL